VAKVLRCRDLGLTCDHETRGESVEDVLQKAYAHALLNHSDLKLTTELGERARAAIKDA